MKRSISNLGLRAFFSTLAAILGLGLSVQAQPGGPGGGPGAGMDTAVANLFGDFKAFSAKSEIQMDSGRSKLSMTVNFTFLDGQMRTELDMANLKAAEIPADAQAMMKQMGMDKTISLVNAEKKTMAIIYPGLKSYAEMPLPQDQAKNIESKEKIQKKELGKETIEGHPCVKNQVIMPEEKKNGQEILIWNATDLRDFPVQIQILKANKEKITVNYREIKFDKPSAALFTLPEGFTKYDSLQSLMQGAMMKMMGNGGLGK